MKLAIGYWVYRMKDRISVVPMMQLVYYGTVIVAQCSERDSLVGLDVCRA